MDDTGDVYFVPAFTGLFGPHWDPDARGWVSEVTEIGRTQILVVDHLSIEFSLTPCPLHFSFLSSSPVTAG